MATIPPFGWRVPLSSDKPAGAQQMTDLATDIANTVAGFWETQGQRIVTRTLVQPVSGSGGLTITFPAGSFSGKPIVIAQLGDESATLGYLQIVDSAVSATQFAVRVVGRNGANHTAGGNIRLNYIAIGPAGAGTMGEGA